MFYGARWFDPSLGRFTQADTMTALASQGVQAWDRYAGMNNSPMMYADPSGHKAVDCENDGNCSTDPEWQENKIEPTWRDDDDYDSKTDSLPNWGENWGQTYMDRAYKVWIWMCRSKGWWGNGCPNSYDLAAWLLDNEVGVMLRKPNYYGKALDAAQLIVTYTLYLFNDGIDPRADLGKYTSFYNPGTDSTSFNSKDWILITTTPSDAAYYTVDRYKNDSYPYPGYDLVWWDPADRQVPSYTKYLFEVVQVQLHIALK